MHTDAAVLHLDRGDLDPLFFELGALCDEPLYQYHGVAVGSIGEGKTAAFQFLEAELAQGIYVALFRLRVAAHGDDADFLAFELQGGTVGGLQFQVPVELRMGVFHDG